MSFNADVDKTLQKKNFIGEEILSLVYLVVLDGFFIYTSFQIKKPNINSRNFFYNLFVAGYNLEGKKIENSSS